MQDRKEYQRLYRIANKDKIKKQRARHYKTNKEAINKKNNTYYAENKINITAKQKEYYMTTKPKRLQQMKDYYQSHRITALKNNKEYSSIHLPEIKNKVLTHYGNGKCACVKCGFSDIRALSIDHISGGGGKHRKDNNITHFYNWLIKNNYPNDFQTLCLNCQFVKRAEAKEQYKNKGEF